MLNLRSLKDAKPPGGPSELLLLSFSASRSLELPGETHKTPPPECCLSRMRQGSVNTMRGWRIPEIKSWNCLQPVCTNLLTRKIVWAAVDVAIAVGDMQDDQPIPNRNRTHLAPNKFDGIHQKKQWFPACPRHSCCALVLTVWILKLRCNQQPSVEEGATENNGVHLTTVRSNPFPLDGGAFEIETARCVKGLKGILQLQLY